MPNKLVVNQLPNNQNLDSINNFPNTPFFDTQELWFEYKLQNYLYSNTKPGSKTDLYQLGWECSTWSILVQLHKSSRNCINYANKTCDNCWRANT